MQQEAVAAKDARAQRLLEADADLNLRGGAEKAVAVNHVFVSGRDFDGHDVAGEFGGERDLAGGPGGAVLGHENGAAAGHALGRIRGTDGTFPKSVNFHFGDWGIVRTTSSVLPFGAGAPRGSPLIELRTGQRNVPRN